jgi:hypothetical protein
LGVLGIGSRGRSTVPGGGNEQVRVLCDEIMKLLQGWQPEQEIDSGGAPVQETTRNAAT